ncbi:hypothetical protein [Methanomethylophilus alvi]|uniref:hypothetical protein n=1 Tax=Methanomethylophilus alvi TaxID=1291540 RepID=UPI0037DD9AA4
MNANESESNHKKKLIVPIIAIMLCAVAVIGAGYAYQSSLSLKDNSLDGGNITVTLNTGGGNAHPVFYKDDNKLDVVFTQEIVYAMDDSTGQYVPTVNTTANGVDTSNSSNLGTLSVKYSNTPGKDVYAYVSVKVSASSIMVGNTELELSSIVNGISISPIGGANPVNIGLSDMVTPKEFNLYGAHALLGVVEGNYSVVLNVNTDAFTKVGGDQGSMSALIDALEDITFEITVNISDVDPDGSA